MPSIWTESCSRELWQSRQWNVVGSDHNINERRSQSSANEQQRIQRNDSEKAFFMEMNANREQHSNAETFIPSSDIRNLEFWISHGSSTFCNKCKAILLLRLMPNFHKRPLVRRAKTCTCQTNRYIMPTIDSIPNVLQNLSKAELCALRPITIHCGEYIRAENGYRKKDGMFRLSWSKTSVEAKISAITNEESRNRCLNAYNYLMDERRSSYRSFVEERDRLGNAPPRINVYDQSQNKYIECCLWPHLYPTRESCETALDGRGSRLSTKMSFMKKVHSSIVDYGTTYELLHFHYDLWLFKTVSGALSSGRFRMCSPARSLETKPFSAEYWKWQHRFLKDAVQQFGPPSIFLTISPYEWSFPAPPWLISLRHITGRGPTELAAYETTHIVHVLEQIIRGYLCGSNSNKWTNHVFNYNNLSKYANIRTFFYRFEFQNRGTVHVHLLVWLKDIERIRLNLIRADIPWADMDLAYEITKLQKSDRGAFAMRELPTKATSSNNMQVIDLHHPADAFALNLRGYISSVVPSLKCRMDVQTSDGHGMLLRYVTSYVSKWQDSYSNEALYSVHVGPYEAAYKHLICLKPLEPEMWMALSNTKMSWTSSRRKKFRFPSLEDLPSNVTHQKYLRRQPKYHEYSFLEWLRSVDETKEIEYKSGFTLVGVKMVSPLKDLFFMQHLIIHYPHFSLQQLYHRNHSELPSQIKHFAAAFTLMNAFWSHPDEIRNYFKDEGHKAWFVETLVSHISSLSDYFKLFQRRVLTSQSIEVDMPAFNDTVNDPMQNRFLQVVQICFRKREQYYHGHLRNSYEDSSEDEEGVFDEHFEGEQIQQQNQGEVLTADDEKLDWKKFLLVTGSAGTGKTHCVKRAIQQAINDDRDVLVTTPTGFLATTYTATFLEEIQADTIHSAFHYPVNRRDQAKVNWDLMRFDLIVIDEVSMVSKLIMDHVVGTINQLSFRPLVIMCGDECQQQPIETIDQNTIQVPSALGSKEFYNITNHFKLTVQHRCEDHEFLNILNHLRYYKPSQNLLDNIQQPRILCASSKPTDQEIERAIKDHADATVITVSRSACNRVNQVAINYLFKGQEPLMYAKCDCDMEAIPLYHDLPVIITQNRDKANGVVNGQKAKIHMVENKTVFLRLSNGKIVSTYVVTNKKQDGTQKSVYPFVPGFALTICKSQGQTLPKVIVWMDSMRVPSGAAYVALSRVRRMKDLYFLTRTYPQQYKPVSDPDE